jgi:hypothetical protein
MLLSDHSLLWHPVFKERLCTTDQDCPKAHTCWPPVASESNKADTPVAGTDKRKCRPKCEVPPNKGLCSSLPQSECKTSPFDGIVRCECKAGFVHQQQLRTTGGKVGESSSQMGMCLRSCRRTDDCTSPSDVW